MSKPTTIMKGTVGLNNAVDASRLKIDHQSGLCELAAAVNVDIENNNRIRRRQGSVQKRSEASHSIFCDGGPCLFVSQGGLYELAADFSRTLIRSGFSDDRMRYLQAATRIYYSNGPQKGYVEDGESYAWVAPAYLGPETDRIFDVPANVRHMDIWNGRMLVTDGPLIYVSEALQFNRFNLAENILGVGSSDIRMIKAADKALFVSDNKATFRVLGTFQQPEIKQVADYPAIEDTVCRIFDFGENGDGVMWLSTKGVCFGNSEGYFKNITQGRLVLPDAVRGSGIVRNDNFLALMEG